MCYRNGRPPRDQELADEKLHFASRKKQPQNTTTKH